MSHEPLRLGYWRELVLALSGCALFLSASSLLHSLKGARVTVLPFGVHPRAFSLLHPWFILCSSLVRPGFLSRFAHGSSPFLLLSRSHSQVLFMGIHIPFSSVRKLFPLGRVILFLWVWILVLPVAGESFLGSGLAAGRVTPWGGMDEKSVGEMS